MDDTQNDSTGQISELELLRERAKQMGINPGNSGVDALRKKIDSKIQGTPQEEDPEEEAAVTPASVKPKTKREIEQETRERLRKESLALVRCRIYNLNPSKRDLQGEIITIGNKFLGTVRKFIPFGEATEGGYHIPKIIYDDLKSRKFQQLRTKKNAKGHTETSSQMIPEYNIDVLPALTPEELHELATKQAAAERVRTD